MSMGVTVRCRRCVLTRNTHRKKIAHQHEELVVRNAEMERSKQVRMSGQSKVGYAHGPAIYHMCALHTHDSLSVSQVFKG